MATGPISNTSVSSTYRPPLVGGTEALDTPPAALSEKQDSPLEGDGDWKGHGGIASEIEMTDLGVSGIGSGSLEDLLGLDNEPQEAAPTPRQRAESIWHDPSAAGTEEGFRRIERDADDVNGADLDPNLRAMKNEMARQEIRNNQPQVQAALEQLSTAETAQYNKLRDQIKKDPQAELALQVLLLEGKLTDKTKLSSDGKTLLGELGDIATKPLHKDINRSALLGDMVKEIALPSAINQRNRGTCTVTSMQIMMAMDKPAEYARLVGGLASPTGKVKFANGDTAERAKGTTAPDNTGRTASARLFQAAMMEYGNGNQVTYDNRTDHHVQGKKVMQSGLATDQSDRVMDALYGKDMATIQDRFMNSGALDRTLTPSKIVEEIARQTAAGHAVPVGMKWGDRDATGQTHGGHMVLATKVENDRVYYNNPWGQQESISVAEFKSRVTNAHVDASLLPEQTREQRNQGALSGNVVTMHEDLLAQRDRLLAQPPEQQDAAQIANLTAVIQIVGDLRQQVDAKAIASNDAILEINRNLLDLPDPAKRQAAKARIDELLQ